MKTENIKGQVARDLGPRINAALLTRNPARPAYLMQTTATNAVAVEPYTSAMAQLWSAGLQ
jgi:hypothetical protein